MRSCIFFLSVSGLFQSASWLPGSSMLLQMAGSPNGIIYMCMYIHHLYSPILFNIHTLGWLPFWEWGCCYLFEVLISFPLGIYPKRRIARAYDSFIFSFLRKLCTVPVYIAARGTPGFPFLHILPAPSFYFFGNSILTALT